MLCWYRPWICFIRNLCHHRYNWVFSIQELRALLSAHYSYLWLAPTSLTSYICKINAWFSAIVRYFEVNVHQAAGVTFTKCLNNHPPVQTQCGLTLMTDASWRSQTPRQHCSPFPLLTSKMDPLTTIPGLLAERNFLAVGGREGWVFEAAGGRRRRRRSDG